MSILRLVQIFKLSMKKHDSILHISTLTASHWLPGKLDSDLHTQNAVRKSSLEIPSSTIVNNAQNGSIKNITNLDFYTIDLERDLKCDSL